MIGALPFLALLPLVFQEPSLDRFPDWPLRDLEGRWALVRTDLDLRGAVAGEWTLFLRARGEHTLLAWLATTESIGTGDALQALFDEGDPGRLRVAAWRLGFEDSHTASSARKLLQGDSGLVSAWVEKHRDRLDEGMLALAAELPQGRAVSAAVVDSLEPPIDVAELVATVSRAEEARPLGARLSAPRGVLLVEQVRRAIDALAARKVHRPAAVAALLAAARSRPEGLGPAACRAFAALPPEHVPFAELFAIADDATLPAVQREAAYLGATYGPLDEIQPRILLDLSRPAEPWWMAAVRRVGELGGEDALAVLQSIDRSGLLEYQRRALHEALEAIQSRAKPDSAGIPNRK